MTFLKKLGLIVTKIGAAAVGLEPLIHGMLPAAAQAIEARVIGSINQLAGIIVQAEAIGNVLSLPGADKLKIATPLIANEIVQSALLVGKKIAKPELFQQGSQKIADGLADVLNSLHEDGAKEDDKT